MRALSLPLLEASRMLSDEDGWLWLYEIHVPTTPPTRYRLVASREPVQFGTTTSGDPLVWSPAPISHSAIEQNSDGEPPKLQLQVGHANRSLAQPLEDHAGLVGQPVVIHIVHRSHLDDSHAQVRIDGVVTGCAVTPDRVALDVGLRDLFDYRLPPKRFSKFHCGHQYGDDLCGAPVDDAAFLADEPDCAKTLPDCRRKGATELALGLPVLHPLRFGGFPGIPRPSAR